MLYNDLGPADLANPSGILVTTTANAAPEPSAWAMMIVGFLLSASWPIGARDEAQLHLGACLDNSGLWWRRLLELDFVCL